MFVKHLADPRVDLDVRLACSNAALQLAQTAIQQKLMREKYVMQNTHSVEFALAITAHERAQVEFDAACKAVADAITHDERMA
jgi:hypothetical protein